MSSTQRTSARPCSVPGARSRRAWSASSTSRPTTARAPRPCVFRAAKPERPPQRHAKGGACGRPFRCVPKPSIFPAGRENFPEKIAAASKSGPLRRQKPFVFKSLQKLRTRSPIDAPGNFLRRKFPAKHFGRELVGNLRLAAPLRRQLAGSHRRAPAFKAVRLSLLMRRHPIDRHCRMMRAGLDAKMARCLGPEPIGSIRHHGALFEPRDLSGLMPHFAGGAPPGAPFCSTRTGDGMQAFSFLAPTRPSRSRHASARPPLFPLQWPRRRRHGSSGRYC